MAASSEETGSRVKLGLGVLALIIAVGIGFRFLHEEPGKPGRAGAKSSQNDDTGDSRHDVAPGQRVASTPIAETEAGAKEGYFARFGWGSGPGKLGRDRPDEANPEGPMSFAPLPGGGIAILDQVNGRMVFTDKDGNPVKEIKTTLSQPQEIAVGKDGTVAVADRLVDKSVQIYDPNGKPVGQLPVVGDKIKEGGAMTGLFVDGKNVYAENAHGILALLGTTDGTPAERQTDLYGRPSRDGTLLLSAGITNAQQGRAWVSAMKRLEKKELFTRELKESAPLLSISMLDTDAQGIIYVAYITELAENEERLVLHCLSPKDGHVIGTTEVPMTDMPEETFRDFSVADDGTVYHAEMTEQGMNYRAIRCP